MKPAGGIRTAKQAIQYLVLVKETHGAAWLNNKFFDLAPVHVNDVLCKL